MVEGGGGGALRAAVADGSPGAMRLWRLLSVALALVAVIWLSRRTLNYIDALEVQLKQKQQQIKILKAQATSKLEGKEKELQDLKALAHTQSIKVSQAQPKASMDCRGVWGGAAKADQCGQCHTDTGTACAQDCQGIWGGIARKDECGQCGGDGSSCTTPSPGPPPPTPAPGTKPEKHCGLDFNSTKCNCVGHSQHCSMAGFCGDSQEYKNGHTDFDCRPQTQAPQEHCGPDFNGAKCNCVGHSQYCSIAGFCGDSQEHRNGHIEHDCRPPMGHTFDDPKLLSADRRVQLVYATTFYTEQRTWPDKTTICPVGKRNIIVTETYNTSFAAKADGLIYYGPDLYHTNLPPFGDGTK